MPIGDIYSGEIHIELQDNPNIYQWYYHVDAVSDESMVPFDINVDLGNWFTQLQPLHTTDVSFICTLVRQVFPTASLPFTAALSAAGTRTTTATLPGQCSLVVTEFGDTTNPTRSNRGRIFFTGADNADQVNGVWDNPGIVTEYQTAYNSFQVSFAGTGGNQFSRVTFSPKRAAAATAPWFWVKQMARIKTLVRTQRRRQPLSPCEVYVDSEYAPPS